MASFRTRPISWILFMILLCIVVLHASDNRNEKMGYDSSWSWKKGFMDLGLYDTFIQINNAVKQNVKAAQAYTDEEIVRDWNMLRSEPSLKTFFNFIRNTTLPMFVRFIAVLGNWWNHLYLGVMKFTKQKCDAFLGKEAPLHPWNVMKLEKETVSMLVFLYAFALSLILVKLCSFWNFLAWLAIGYLAYAIGGPYWLFRWLVFLTGFFWYLFDMVVTYPYYFAGFFLLMYIYYGFSGQERKANTLKLPREFQSLTQTVDELERKTDLIETKIDRLTELLEK